jgi:hypothetical protein
VNVVRNIFTILGCHEREKTQLRSQQARQNLLLQKSAPQTKSKHPSRESTGVPDRVSSEMSRGSWYQEEVSSMCNFVSITIWRLSPTLKKQI